MILKVFIISVILLVIAGLGFGIKLLFDKDAELPKGSCQVADDKTGTFSCGCCEALCDVSDIEQDE